MGARIILKFIERPNGFSVKITNTSPPFDMPKKVLIVEDSHDTSRALQLLIEFEGYQTIVAFNASDGRAFAQAAKPDLILMDIGLPDYSGIELTRQLRASPENAETPIVCVTAYPGGPMTDAINAGCNEAFSKNKFLDSFRPTLKKYLGA